MRRCLRCEAIMVEDLAVTVTDGGYGLVLREKGMFKGSLGKLKGAVCPACGYTETYVEDTDKIKELLDKKR